MALPSTLSYDVLPNAAQSRTYKTVISSRNSTSFTPNGRMEFSFPQAEASYLDLSNVSLKFKLQAEGTGKKANLDFSILSAISRVVVSCGGQVLSDISSFNVLATAMMQASGSPESFASMGKCCLGTNGIPDLPLLGAEIDETGLVFSIPMTFGLFSSKKQLPLDLSSPVVVSVYLSSLDEMLFCLANNDDKPTGLLFSEAEMHCYVVQLNNEAQLFLDQSLGEMSYNWNITDVANMQTSVAGGATSTVLPFRYSSLKSVCQIVRNTTSSVPSTAQFTVSGRSRNCISEFSLDIGGQIIPSRRVKASKLDTSEAYSETMVALFGNNEIAHQNSLNNVHIASISYTPADGVAAVLKPQFTSRNDYKQNTSGITAHTYNEHVHNPGTFIAAISLESYKPATESDSLLCGLNTIGSQVSWNNKTVNEGTDASAPATIDYFGFYDSVISLDPITRILTANA